MKRALVFVAGELGDVIAGDLPEADLIVAADAGLHHAHALGVKVDVLIGDMDSVVEPTDVVQIRFPPDKDASDFELAVDFAIEQGAEHVTVVGGLGGRIDHFFALLTGMCREEWAHITIDALMGRTRAYVLRDELVIKGTPGEYISQFAVNGAASGLTLTGVKWAGHYPTVAFGSSLCLSDELIDSSCRMTLGGGVMLVLHELENRRL